MNFFRKIMKKLNLSFKMKTKIKNSPPNVYFGRGTYYGTGCVFIARDGGEIHIGNYCSIAEKVTILNVNHKYDSISTFPFSVLYSESQNTSLRDREIKNVTIGNDVWIGTSAIILKGVTVGDGAVIGAGSIVTKDVPSYGIVAGNPSRLIKYRFGEDCIKQLLEIKWWEWPEETIKNRINDFYLPVDQFIKIYKTR